MPNGEIKYLALTVSMLERYLFYKKKLIFRTAKLLQLLLVSEADHPTQIPLKEEFVYISLAAVFKLRYFSLNYTSN